MDFKNIELPTFYLEQNEEMLVKFFKTQKGRPFRCSVFSVDKTNKQTEYGQINKGKEHKSYVLIDDFPLFNLSEEAHLFNFDEGGYNEEEVTLSAIFDSSIYRISVGDVLIIKNTIVQGVDSFEVLSEEEIHKRGSNTIVKINFKQTHFKREDVEKLTHNRYVYNYSTNELDNVEAIPVLDILLENLNVSLSNIGELDLEDELTKSVLFFVVSNAYSTIPFIGLVKDSYLSLLTTYNIDLTSIPAFKLEQDNILIINDYINSLFTATTTDLEKLLIKLIIISTITGKKFIVDNTVTSFNFGG